MNNEIRYADLWALLRKLGFDCDSFDDRNHRICDFAPNGTRIVLHNYPPEEPVRQQILIGVRLQLDNGGVMSRADFDRWADRRGGDAAVANGARSKRNGKKRSSQATTKKV